MTVDSGEAFRGTVHYVAGSLFAIMAAWNLMVACEDKRGRHIANAIMYGAGACYEARQVFRHWTHA